VSGNLLFSKEVRDTGLSGNTDLRNSRISAAISAQLTSGALPTDPNGVYIFATSSDVKESGFCTQFLWIPHPSNAQRTRTLNGPSSATLTSAPAAAKSRLPVRTARTTGVGGADGMINVITHETEETITDPDLNAWFDASGAERCR